MTLVSQRLIVRGFEDSVLGGTLDEHVRNGLFLGFYWD